MEKVVVCNLKKDVTMIFKQENKTDKKPAETKASLPSLCMLCDAYINGFCTGNMEV